MTANPLESTVETHIDSTSQLVWRVDLAFSLLTVVSLLFGGLFLAVIADHWLFKEGLSITLRLGFFAALFAIAGLYSYWRIVPLFRYQINPVYTADLIERDVNTFKNSLINWLLLREERAARAEMPSDRMNDRMFDGVVKTAAANVQIVPAGHAVDRRKVIWVGTVFLVFLIAFVAYYLFSPKNPFTTFWRVLIPIASIERPQAAQFRNVKPGDATVLQGETITISAEVISRSPDPIYLVYSTDDGQAVEQKIPMTQAAEKMVFESPTFPPGKQGFERGFNSSVDYRIIQGENRSKRYRLDVQPAASIEIVSLQYDFPDYTGKPQEIEEHGGDIRALEGTTVTVSVRSTLPLQKIALVYDNNPANNVGMDISNAEKTEAKGKIALKTPFRYQTFSFVATDEQGNNARRSGIYRIEVIPDQPPRVQWADTAKHLMEPEIQLPLNETLQLPIQAEDPDFALRYLRLKTESQGRQMLDVQLLESPATGPTRHRGPIKATATFTPTDKRLAAGDTAEIWVEAHDTKLPEANVSSTRRIKIKVVPPKAKESEEQQKEDNPQEKQGNEGESKQDDQKKQGADPTGENAQNQEKKEGESGAGSEEENPNDEQNPNGGDNGDDGEQNQEDNLGQDEQKDEKGQEENSNQEDTGTEPSEGDGGEQGSEEQPDNGKGKEGGNDSANQLQEENDTGAGQGGEQEQESSVNPETQDGDAMERIVDQMKDDGKFQGDNPFSRNDNQRQRNNALDPNSPNQSKQGNDPSNPKESNQPPDGNQQEQQDKPSDGEPKDGKPQEGRAGDMDSQSGDNEGSQQDGKGEQDSQGGQDTGQQGGDSGNQQQKQGGEDAGEGSSGEQQSANGMQNTNQNGNSPTQSGDNTGGGTGTTKDTMPDDPNMKHASEVTNLILDYLENQLKDKPSDDLLKKLGWTEEQLRQFHAKWKKMFDASKQPQEKEEGTNALVEAWKSMGLLPNQNRQALQESQTGKRDDKGVTETKRIPVPAAIRGRFQEYNDSVGK